MANISSTIFILSLLVLATFTTACVPCGEPTPMPKPKPKPTPKPTPKPSPSPKTPAPMTPAPVTPAPKTPAPVTPAPVTPAPKTPAPVTPAPVTPAPKTPAPVTPAPVTPAPVTPAPVTPAPKTPAPVTPAPAPAPEKTCPIDTLKLGVCADVLGLVNVAFGSQVTTPCCSLIKGLSDLEAALCLCTAIKANVLGLVKLDIPVALSVLVSGCAKTVPPGFKCA